MSDEKRSEDGETLEEGKAAGEATETAPKAEAEGGDVAVAEADEDEGGEADDDAANPAAIARRVAALGADDETEALAREEERKLAERRAAQKKGKKKKGGLEAAASKKLAKIGTRAEPRRSVAVAADADPLLERTTKLSDWAKQNQKLVQMVGGVIVLALLGVAGFLYYDHKRETEASTILTKAVEAQHAQIGEPKKDDEDDAQLYFKTYDDRRSAALKQYKEVEAKFAGTGAAILARLAEGSLLLDKRDADGAIGAFTDVKSSPLAAADVEVKGRALEGLGFAHEIKAAAKPSEKDKELDAALAAFKELEAVDGRGFKQLAQYHQARVLMGKGEKDKAKELLVKVRDDLAKPEEGVAPGLPVPPPFPFLKEVVRDRLHEIDPALTPKMPAGGGSGMELSPEQIKKLFDQQQKKGGKH